MPLNRLSNETLTTVSDLLSVFLEAKLQQFRQLKITAEEMMRVEDNDHTRGQALYAWHSLCAIRDCIASIPATYKLLVVRNPDPSLAVIEAVEYWTRARSKPEVNANDS